MLWWLASAAFVCLAIREAMAGRSRTDGGFYLPYFLIVCGLAVACAWPPLSTWRLERRLSAVSTRLAEGRQARVHCNTIIDTMFSPMQLHSGYAEFGTGRIHYQKPWCSVVRRYLRDPERAGPRELSALNLITHEAMHVRGERNEAIAECQSVRRNYRTARLLGVPDPVARRNALDFYEQLYRQRGSIGGIQAAYFSSDCAPGKALDEKLDDSTWQ